MLTIFIIFCVIIYVFSIIEIIGAHILTEKKQGLRWASEFMIFPILFPPLAPIVAFDILTDAKAAYQRNNYNNKVFMESLYYYLKHDRRSINEWIDYKRKQKKGL